MNQKRLKQYAALAVKVGANVQKGQEVIVKVSADQYVLAREIVNACYECGAARVRVEFIDDAIDRTVLLKTEIEHMALKKWQIEKFKHQSETLPAVIDVVSSDPEALKGVDPQKLMEIQRLQYKKIKKYEDAMDNKYQWTIVGAASPAWAKAVFPGLAADEAVEKLWRAIFKTVHLPNSNDDPVKIWDMKNRDFQERTQYLNELKIKTLHYKSKNGTDFSIGLLPESIWEAGGEYTKAGVFFNPNLPTEEFFTTPDKKTANGVVVASKPLSVHGDLVEDFRLTFQNGACVKVEAAKGQEILENLIKTDKGAKFLGEVALVPKESPIQRSNVLFLNTLYDENAACHLALGRAYTANVRGYESKSEKELTAMGVNTSMIHVDFMIGNEDMAITAETYDGKTVTIFENGTWK